MDFALWPFDIRRSCEADEKATTPLAQHEEDQLGPPDSESDTTPDRAQSSKRPAEGNNDTEGKKARAVFGNVLRRSMTWQLLED
eukprot:8977632-Alexandrium_andersonii.AAC.1